MTRYSGRARRTSDPRRIVACTALVLAAVACDDAGPPTEPPPPSLDAELRRALASWGVLPILSIPRQDAALVDLGQALMFDKILSGNRDVSCASCHQPLAHGGDGLSLAIGTGGLGQGATRMPGPGRTFLPRNAPSLLNQGLGAYLLLWDGRVSGVPQGGFTTPAGSALPGGLSNILAAQALFPIVNRDEMRGLPGDRDRLGNPNELAELGDGDYAGIWRGVMRRLLAISEYAAKFQAAFPSTPANALGMQHAANAIAAFQLEAYTRTRSPFDRYLDRDDAALSIEAKRGAMLFFGRARCSTCHAGPLLGGNAFANVGVPQLGPGTGRGAPLDHGRGEAIERPEYRFAFRVPALRNVELTAPYMHNGAYATLEAVVRHYNDVPKALREYDTSQLQPDLRASHHGDEATIAAVLETLDGRLRQPLGLTEAEMRDIVAFLKSLTDPSARDLSGIIPARVPSGLPVDE